MKTKNSCILKELSAYKVCNLKVDSNQNKVNAELWDGDKKKHKLEFDFDSYLFVDQEMLSTLENMDNLKRLSPGTIEIISEQRLADGSVDEKIVASPNIMLRSDSTNLFIQSNSFSVDGKNYHLTPLSSRSNYVFYS